MGPAAWDQWPAKIRYRIALREQREREATVRAAVAVRQGMGVDTNLWTAWVRDMIGEE